MKYVYFVLLINVNVFLVSLVNASHSPVSIERKSMIALPIHHKTAFVREEALDDIELGKNPITHQILSSQDSSERNVTCAATYYPPHGIDCQLLAQKLIDILGDSQVSVDQDVMVAHLRKNLADAYKFQSQFLDRPETRGKVKIDAQDLIQLLKFTQHATNLSAQESREEARVNRCQKIWASGIATLTTLSTIGVSIYSAIKK